VLSNLPLDVLIWSEAKFFSLAIQGLIPSLSFFCVDFLSFLCFVFVVVSFQVIFVNGVRRAQELNKLLVEHNFPSMAIYGGLSQDERLDRYNKFKEYKSRILVSTDIFGRGVDFERVNIVFNYDMPGDPATVSEQQRRTKGAQGLPARHAALALWLLLTFSFLILFRLCVFFLQYLHRVGRSCRFGTNGLAITFVSSEEDTKVLEVVQSRFEVEITELPEEIDVSTYMSA